MINTVERRDLGEDLGNRADCKKKLLDGSLKKKKE